MAKLFTVEVVAPSNRACPAAVAALLPRTPPVLAVPRSPPTARLRVRFGSVPTIPPASLPRPTTFQFPQPLPLLPPPCAATAALAV